MDELTYPYKICKKIEKMAKNMNANKEFKSDTTKNQKIVTLTSKVKNMFKRVQSAEIARGGGNGDRRGGNRINGGGAGTTLSKIKSQDMWCVIFNAKTITHNEKKMKWCDKHKSKDESVLGGYMDMDHDHDAWLAARKLRYSEHCGKRNRDTSTKDPNPDAIPSFKAKKQKGLKLALNQKLATALVTQHNMSQEEANYIFTTAYNEAQEGLN